MFQCCPVKNRYTIVYTGRVTAHTLVTLDLQKHDLKHILHYFLLFTLISVAVLALPKHR